MDITKIYSHNVLVTGATGFIGRALVNYLLQAGARVTCLVRAHSLPQFPENKSLSLLVVDSFTPENVRLVLAKKSFEYVFHLAAYGVNPQQVEPLEMLHSNVDATIALLAEAKNWPLKGFIYTGSCAEYGVIPQSQLVDEDHVLKPVTLYGASKAAAGTYALAFASQYQLPFVYLRLFGVYGPGEAQYRLMPYLIDLLSKKQSVDLSPGNQVRDFLYIDDVIQALITAALLQNNLTQRIYNICSSIPVTIREIAQSIAQTMECDASLLKFGERDYRPGEVMWLVGKNEAFKRDTQWHSCVNLTQGMSKMIDARATV